MQKLKLPKISQFSSRNYNLSPYDKLYLWTYEQLRPTANLLFKDDKSPYSVIPKGYRIDNTAFWLNEKDYQSLEDKVKLWIKNCYYRTLYKNSEDKQYVNWRIEQEYAMYSFNYSPASFGIYNSKYKDGYVYVKKNYLVKKAR